MIPGGTLEQEHHKFDFKEDGVSENTKASLVGQQMKTLPTKA